MKTLLKILLIAAFALRANASDYATTTLEKARAMFHSATNATTYAAAAEQYEYLVNEEGVRNGHLFYTLGNSWFMAGDVGRAILNYRRALDYLPNDADAKHNLEAALKLRADLIPEKEPHPLVEKTLGWHIGTSTSFRWWLFAASWIGFWAAWHWMGRSTKKEARVTAIATGALSAVLLLSLTADAIERARFEPGVITAQEVLARKGDGDMYAPAFLDPLHSGTEFKRVENRGDWWRIRLADGQRCWIPASAAETVALSE